MNPKQEDVMRIVRNIYAVQDDDIQCDVVAEQMMLSADAAHSDEASQKQFPAMWRHFQLCPDCYEEYCLLMKLVEAEDARQGSLSSAIGLPPSVDSESSFVDDLRDVWTKFQNAIRIEFPGFQPIQAVALRGGLLASPVEFALGQDDIELLVELSQSNKNSALRTLLCEFDILNSELPSDLNDTTIQLLRADSGEPEQTQKVENNEVIFHEIPRAKYNLHFRIGNRAYMVEGVNLSSL